MENAKHKYNGLETLMGGIIMFNNGQDNADDKLIIYVNSSDVILDGN